MNKWEWSLVSKIIKQTISDVFIEAVPGCVIISSIIVIISKLTEGKRVYKKSSLEKWWSLLQVNYGYLLFYTTILRRKFGMYKANISYDLYFLRVGWYEIAETILNIFLFIPFGLILRNKRIIIFRCLAFSTMLTFIIETIQFTTGCGTFEIADIFLNVCGSLIGFGIMDIVQIIEGRQGHKKQ